MASRPDRSAPLPDVPSATFASRTVNGVDLNLVTAGEPNDPLVVLLHGFPEFWYGWSDAVEPLVEAGYRVLVPDQRGYNRSEKPASRRAYRLAELSADVEGLVASEGRESAYVVGHDWGALVGWDLALRSPDVVDRLTAVNVPHPTVFLGTMTSDLAQLRKSWYVFFFQLPRLPEWSARRNDFGLWVDALREGSNPGTFTDEDLERYRAAWGREGATSSMIDWYRALLRDREAPPSDRVTVPTLLVWGEHDQALIPEMAPRSIDYCEDGRLETFSDATHWIHHEYPERVTELLLDHGET